MTAKPNGHRARRFFDPTKRLRADSIAPAYKPTWSEARAARRARMPADKHGTAVGHEYWGCTDPCCFNAASRRWKRYR